MKGGAPAFLALLLAACGGAPEPAPVRHMVVFDRNGEAIDPAADFEPLSAEAFCRHAGAVVEGLEAWGRERDAAGEPKRLFLFVHGGLNTVDSSTERATRLTPEILAGGSYPVFVNWEASLSESYADHLFFIRGGEDVRNGDWLDRLFVATFPAYFLVDLARGLSRSPLSAYYELEKVLRSLGVDWETGTDRRLREIAEDLLSRSDDAGAMKVEIGRDERSGWERAGRQLALVPTIPTKFLSAVAIDAAGQSSWNVLKRRIRLLFHRESGDHGPGAVAAEGVCHPDSTRGRLAVFVDHLAARLAADPSWEVVLSVHSMGAIVANQILRETPELPVDRLVYMAPASTFRDFKDSVLPYLERHPGTTVHLLTLHPGEEIVETNVGDLIVRGSLLVWIDDYFSAPEAHHDRVLGTYRNLIAEAHEIPEGLRSRFEIKVFPARTGGSEGTPQKHGDFTEVEFWRDEFWRVGFPP